MEKIYTQGVSQMKVVEYIPKSISDQCERISDQSKRIYVATTNNDKLTAVYLALSNQGQHKVFGLSGISSQVSEQPVDTKMITENHPDIKKNETYRGCFNRYTAAEEYLKENGGFDILVSIENGLVYNEGKWYDIAYILVNNGGNLKLLDFIPVQINLEFYKYIDQSINVFKKSRTMGSLVEETFGFPKGSWFENNDPSKRSRVDILKMQLEQV